jgi:hypothetical protein
LLHSINSFQMQGYWARWWITRFRLLRIHWWSLDLTSRHFNYYKPFHKYTCHI